MYVRLRTRSHKEVVPMKRLVVVVAVLGVLLMSATAGWADPINVGGNITSFASSSGRPFVFPGKGIPQGVPFQFAETSVLLSPINVGGN